MAPSEVSDRHFRFGLGFRVFGLRFLAAAWTRELFNDFVLVGL